MGGILETFSLVSSLFRLPMLSSFVKVEYAPFSSHHSAERKKVEEYWKKTPPFKFSVCCLFLNSCGVAFEMKFK